MLSYQLLSYLLIHGVISMQASENNKENVKVIFTQYPLLNYDTIFYFHTIINNTFIASLRSGSRDCQ